MLKSNRISLFLCATFLFAAGVTAQSRRPMPAPATPKPAAPAWLQFGGPNRNFIVDSKGLAASWPSDGPRRIWSRKLGEGYSGIVVDGSRLYTMYREGSQEILVALDAQTGKTLWEQRYDAPILPKMAMENGPGPHSTPLVSGGHVYSIGVTGKMHCQDKVTGKGVWYHDLLAEFNAPLQGRGYSSSPIAYKKTIILPVGGPGQALMAFNENDGSVAWKRNDLDLAPASPLLINVDGQDQLVQFMANEVTGLDPNNGELLWRHPHRTQYGLNISTPVWGEGNLLFCTSAYTGGSRVVQLQQSAGKTTVKELWFSNRMRVHIGNTLRIGDYIYGSSGDFGPAFLLGVNVRTGQEAWRDRSLAKANMVHADGKTILVDEDGSLALATLSPTGLQLHSRVDLLKSHAWTAPTLVGTKLYVRDRASIMALDVGAQ